MYNRNVRKGKEAQDGRNARAHHVDPEHHLLTGNFVSDEDLVLGGVDRAIQREIDEQVGYADYVGIRGRALRPRRRLALLLVAHVHEHGDACSNHEYDKILVWCEFAAVEEDIHDHDWNKFAGLP